MSFTALGNEARGITDSGRPPPGDDVLFDRPPVDSRCAGARVLYPSPDSAAWPVSRRRILPADRSTPRPRCGTHDGDPPGGVPLRGRIGGAGAAGQGIDSHLAAPAQAPLEGSMQGTRSWGSDHFAEGWAS